MTLLVVETLENLFMYLLPSDWAVISCIKWMSFAPYVAQAVKSSFFFFFFFFSLSVLRVGCLDIHIR